MISVPLGAALFSEVLLGFLRRPATASPRHALRSAHPTGASHDCQIGPAGHGSDRLGAGPRPLDPRHKARRCPTGGTLRRPSPHTRASKVPNPAPTPPF